MLQEFEVVLMSVKLPRQLLLLLLLLLLMVVVVVVVVVVLLLVVVLVLPKCAREEVSPEESVSLTLVTLEGGNCPEVTRIGL